MSCISYNKYNILPIDNMTETSSTSKIESTELERPAITILKQKKQRTESSSVPTTILPKRVDKPNSAESPKNCYDPFFFRSFLYANPWLSTGKTTLFEPRVGHVFSLSIFVITAPADYVDMRHWLPLTYTRCIIASLQTSNLLALTHAERS